MIPPAHGDFELAKLAHLAIAAPPRVILAVWLPRCLPCQRTVVPEMVAPCGPGFDLFRRFSTSIAFAFESALIRVVADPDQVVAHVRLPN